MNRQRKNGGTEMVNHMTEIAKMLGVELNEEFEIAGYKNGKWLDITWFEKNISTCELNPKDIVSIKNLKIFSD